jgi:hypothetical protein
MTTLSVATGTPVSHVAGLLHTPLATLVTVAATAANAFTESANTLTSNTAVNRLRRGVVFIGLLRVVRVESSTDVVRGCVRDQTISSRVTGYVMASRQPLKGVRPCPVRSSTWRTTAE